MKRKEKQVYAIITSDWHLREEQNVPICRTDDFWNVQWEKVDFISSLQRKYDCPVLHAGDLFDHWKPSPMLLAKAMQHIPKDFFTVYGNHDLPQHNLDLAYKCGIYVLQQAGKLKVLDGTHWNTEPVPLVRGLGEHDETMFLVWHVLTYQGKKPWHDCPAPKAAKLLMQYPDCQMIITGDNHKTFVEEYDGRYLINPGNIFRMDADQIDHKPCVFLWFTNNTIEQVFIPIEENVVSREHIEERKVRQDRIDAFISSLNTDWEVGASFEENLKHFITENNTHPTVIEIITKMNPKA